MNFSYEIFRATKRFQIDVEPLIEQLVEYSKSGDKANNEGMKQDLEDALTSKQETEAALITAQARITQLETALRDGTKIHFMTLIYDLSGCYVKTAICTEKSIMDT